MFIAERERVTSDSSESADADDICRSENWSIPIGEFITDGGAVDCQSGRPSSKARANLGGQFISIFMSLHMSLKTM